MKGQLALEDKLSLKKLCFVLEDTRFRFFVYA